MKVLVVDDALSARLLIKHVLSRAGHEVVEAEDGVQALGAIEAAHTATPIELVVLDIDLPVMNGLDCLRAIRSRPDWTDLHVFMCSAESGKETIIEAMVAGANGHILKPFEGELMIDHFRNASS